jgi:hypothetical protein
MARFPVAYVGQPISADFWNSGVDNWLVKASATSVTNSTTLITDPELSSMTLGVGVWRVATLVLAQLNTANQTVDIKMTYAFTGTATATRRVFGPDTLIGTDAYAANAAGSGVAVVHTQTNSERSLMKLGNTPTGANLTTSVQYGLNDTYPIGIQEELIVTVTVAGDLALQWAQFVAGPGVSTSLMAGSYITSKQIA